ncbi:hypothetical protein CCM_06478 [Cordyceps militaris CM01]|uniref:Uncharacterized protein n=1 Tax=Cordyceps militaris (strain CM01) TaxID=983644 RepID=G3JMM2_CORMM|nr:uncharacterized protein CCM_06478 [Cordyceps militaris CM01]EGX90058.1 hypothetical protein CCM_06478 [Cordyceps militaris CM01]
MQPPSGSAPVFTPPGLCQLCHLPCLSLLVRGKRRLPVCLPACPDLLSFLSSSPSSPVSLAHCPIGNASRNACTISLPVVSVMSEIPQSNFPIVRFLNAPDMSLDHAQTVTAANKPILARLDIVAITIDESRSPVLRPPGRNFTVKANPLRAPPPHAFSPNYRPALHDMRYGLGPPT